MSSTPTSSGPDCPRPSVAEAARALKDIDRHRDQAHSSATNSRWVYVLFAVVFFALAVLLAGFAIQLLQPHWHLDVPYWRTAVGAVGGGALALFGPRCQQALLPVAVRGGRRAGESALDGTH
ncbi:hypothetical protein [Streptomyces sp. NRRL S-1813]|uniref:hypothetical protein n=1 Tax=Streptomyces sp. NRRL S-1813 TaxID=1463888 RepID=UPI000A7F76BF|nr:hypothetical protein [Streptomyces sp. NRRL S-1813]